MSQIIKRRFTLADVTKGSASGEDEADFLPMFHNYFYDYESNSTKVMEPHVFFLIGRKGTGKSLLAKFIEHKFKDRNKHFDKFVKVGSFRNFKYHQLLEYKDEEFTEKEFFFIWKWCLLINISYQLISDQSCIETELVELLRTFLKENFGLKINQKRVFDKSKNIKWTFGSSKVAQLSGQQDSEISAGNYLDYLEDLEDVIISIGQSTNSQFTIFFDDLDDGFEGSEVYGNGICSLIYAVDELNRKFYRADFNGKFILLLRSDIFRALNSSDLNKYKMDNSLMLNWRPEERENSPLFDMLIHRVITALKLNKRIAPEQYNEVFYELFDDTIENRNTALWLLDRTFARPRDLVQLIKIAGEEFPSFNKCGAFALVKTKGLYSQYLYDDVRNEMKGHKSTEFVESSLSLLKGIGRGFTITLDKIRKKKPHLFEVDGGEENVKAMLSFLYRFSVIGNIYHKEGKNSEVASYSWSHREDQAEPDFDATFTIHQGIRIALKLEDQEESIKN
ncbi:P-loop ATPase, Sll1717 family [Alteromonas gracilis]|uniref:P-loop ATPase, Sll1717 family n=1 Tax=Alteromonas gracilis TaxID=1479524 RepID=UPI003737050F